MECDNSVDCLPAIYWFHFHRMLAQWHCWSVWQKTFHAILFERLHMRSRCSIHARLSEFKYANLFLTVPRWMHV